jgi:hypothetical protein
MVRLTLCRPRRSQMYTTAPELLQSLDPFVKDGLPKLKEAYQRLKPNGDDLNQVRFTPHQPPLIPRAP